MNLTQRMLNFPVFGGLETLQVDLAGFGLCPEDWSVTKEDSLHYRIENKEEPGFSFRGEITFYKGKKKWKAIQLVSL